MEVRKGKEQSNVRPASATTSRLVRHTARQLAAHASHSLIPLRRPHKAVKIPDSLKCIYVIILDYSLKKMDSIVCQLMCCSQRATPTQ